MYSGISMQIQAKDNVRFRLKEFEDWTYLDGRSVRAGFLKSKRKTLTLAIRERRALVTKIMIYCKIYFPK